jgi:signal transduction histidine kinase
MQPGIPALKEDIGLMLFRIVQEAITNVLRHAHATEVSVSLKKDSNNLMLRIRDNGRGISKEEVSDPRSFGIIGIRERVQFWGGWSRFQGIRDKGTTIAISIPLNKNNTKNG